MNRDEKEMALWRQFAVAVGFDTADAAVERFRKRFPPQSAAPEAVWYDEPPFLKDGTMRACWIAGSGQLYPAVVYWGGRNWRAYFPGDRSVDYVNGRRVCPIAKPPEPTP